MSEHTPTQLVHDTDLAWDMANAEIPHREVAIRAGQVGLHGVATEMIRNANKAPDLVRSGNDNDSKTLPTTEAASTTESQVAEVEQTAELSRERLSEIMARCAGRASTSWAGRGGTGGFEIPENNIDQPGGFALVYTDKGGGLKNRDHDMVPLMRVAEKYVPQGISEAVVIKQISKTTPSGKPIINLQYFTFTEGLAKDSPYRSKPDSLNRPGNYLWVDLYLHEEDAEALSAAIQSNPGTIRTAVDVMMREQVHASESWDAIKPPYEEWREHNGGVDRIVFSGLDRQVKVLEF